MNRLLSRLFKASQSLSGGGKGGGSESSSLAKSFLAEPLGDRVGDRGMSGKAPCSSWRPLRLFCSLESTCDDNNMKQNDIIYVF